MVITYAHMNMKRLEDRAVSSLERAKIQKKARVTGLVTDESGVVIDAEYEMTSKEEGCGV